MHAAIVGAGVGGLGTALAMSRQGHRVTVIERDATPLPAEPHAAFAWDRRGAPQVRHSHAFLARLRNLLRDRYPDVLDALLAAGATELAFCDNLPAGVSDRAPRPGDDDLVALACRRTTFEWVLRRMVIADGLVEWRDGVAVTGLEHEDDRGGAAGGGAPAVTGIRLDDGTTVAADLTVVATGRRSALGTWLAPLGIVLPETAEDTGIVYLSRFYRLLDGAGVPPQEGPIAGDLGYLKFAVFPGDNGTFSITLAVGAGDGDLRRQVTVPDGFDLAARSLPATAAWIEPDRAEAITEVHLMAGLENRRCSFLDGGTPLVLGLHAVGDAHTCTNPLYGRGCSLALVQADLLADTVAAHPDDAVARALAFESGTRREIDPWYRAAVAQDRDARQRVEAESVGPTEHPSPGDGDGSVTTDTTRAFLRDLLAEGLMPAVRTDPVVFRAFLRLFNLLTPPDALLTDNDVISRVMAVYAERDSRPPEPPAGPDRATLLAQLAAPAT